MLGVLRPARDDLTPAGLKAYRLAHCTTCVGLRREYSWIATVSLSREADFLLMIALAYHNIVDTGKVAMCTGCPVIPRRIVEIPQDIASIVASFSVYVSWCRHRDHQVDNDRSSITDRIISHSTSPHVKRALSILKIDQGSPLHPDNIAKPVCMSASLPDYLSEYHNTIGNAWTLAIIRVLAERVDIRVEKWACRIGQFLSDIQILKDAVDDFANDTEMGKFNALNLIPGTDAERIIQGESLLKSRLLNAKFEFVQSPFNLHDPWRSLLVACLS